MDVESESVPKVQDLARCTCLLRFSPTKLCAKITTKFACSKGHFFSDHSALTNRPDAKTQLSLIFFK